ncbi:MAG TPA: hypothetical protein DGG95_03415 [Cytophagales bacterium]|jgi:hypothetical protein|nr:hypothetical protein [Cytophagales bacterium]
MENLNFRNESREFQWHKILWFTFFIILLNNCIEPYPIKSINYRNLLVVEGFISSELKQHEVVLSKSTAINQAVFSPESGAQVSIKTEDSTITLTESALGHYLTQSMRGVVGKTYQLFITTESGRKIQSEKVILKPNPPIKNLYAGYSTNVPELDFKGGFQIFLDTEDSTNQSHYYRWEYEENWEITKPWESFYEWTGGNNVVYRENEVNICYGIDSTNNVITESTQGLEEDKIQSKVIQVIESSSRKLQVIYSISVKQFTLSSDGYNYWQSLLKTNEGQGQLYNAQPGTVIGNLVSTTDQDIVLGYFDACQVWEKRIFVMPLKFRSAGFVPFEFDSECKFQEFTVVPLDQIGAFYSKPENSNMDIVASSGGGLYLLPKDCCDCTSMGSNVKPSFWPF